MQNTYNLHINKGINYANIGKLTDAERSFLKAIEIDKKNYQAYINLSNIYILQKKIDKCTSLLFNYLSNFKYNENIANHTGKIFYNYRLYQELEQLFEIANLDNIKISKNKKSLFFIQGQYNERNNNLDRSKKAYLKSIQSDIFFFNAYERLLNLYEKSNEIKKLKALIKKGLTNFTNKSEISILKFFKCLALNRERKFQESKNYIIQFNLHTEFQENNNYLIRTFDLESKNNEKLKKYHQAFKNVEDRNKILIKINENKNFNSLNITKTINQYKKFFYKKNFNIIKSNLNFDDDSNLVFLVGFPRSGTTLLDSILRSHSKIRVLEEKPFILDIRHNYFKKYNNNLSSLLKLKQNDKDLIRKQYFKNILHTHNDHKKIIVDKFPLSIIELGFIKCIFPNSKIILSMRHPCDVITSCFFSSFKLNDAMINFLKWDDTIYFYNKVLDLFSFYEKELQLNYLLVKYENVVHDFRNQINNLMKYLDLRYEKNLERFYVTARKREKIATPSYSQVINPLYTTSIGRWTKYKQSREAQKSLEKWINKFNY